MREELRDMQESDRRKMKVMKLREKERRMIMLRRRWNVRAIEMRRVMVMVMPLQIGSSFLKFRSHCFFIRALAFSLLGNQFPIFHHEIMFHF